MFPRIESVTGNVTIICKNKRRVPGGEPAAGLLGVVMSKSL